MPNQGCPSTEEWLAFAVGKQGNSERISQLDQHLDGCPKCLDLLETLPDSDDALISALHRQPGLAGHDHERPCREALLRVLRMGSHEKEGGEHSGRR